MDSRRLRQAGTIAVVTAILWTTLAGGFWAIAQEPDGEPLTNDIVAAEVLARISEMVQSAEGAQLEDVAGPDAATNAAAANNSASDKTGRADNPGRPESSNRFLNNKSQNDDRRSRNRRSSRSKSDKSGGSNSASDSSRGSDRMPSNGSGTNAGSGSLDYAAFKMIVDRNIFDPNRVPRRPSLGVRPPAKQVDSLTLVGIMAYDKGTFAFFDGSASEYQKALKLTDVIAGYKLTNIAPDGVTLAAGTNEVEMRVGAQLRREEHGPWMLTSQGGSYSAIPSSPSTNAVAAAAPNGSDAASSAAESEIIKKLKQRRDQE